MINVVLIYVSMHELSIPVKPCSRELGRYRLPSSASLLVNLRYAYGFLSFPLAAGTGREERDTCDPDPVIPAVVLESV